MYRVNTEENARVCSLNVEGYPHAFIKKLCLISLGDDAEFSITSELDLEALKKSTEDELEGRAHATFASHLSPHPGAMNFNQKRFSWIWQIENTKAYQEEILDLYASIIGRVYSTISAAHLDTATQVLQKVARSQARL